MKYAILILYQIVIYVLCSPLSSLETHSNGTTAASNNGDTEEGSTTTDTSSHVQELETETQASDSYLVDNVLLINNTKDLKSTAVENTVLVPVVNRTELQSSFKTNVELDSLFSTNVNVHNVNSQTATGTVYAETSIAPNVTLATDNRVKDKLTSRTVKYIFLTSLETVTPALNSSTAEESLHKNFVKQSVTAVDKTNINSVSALLLVPEPVVNVPVAETTTTHEKSLSVTSSALNEDAKNFGTLTVTVAGGGSVISSDETSPIPSLYSIEVGTVLFASTTTFPNSSRISQLAEVVPETQDLQEAVPEYSEAASVSYDINVSDNETQFGISDNHNTTFFSKNNSVIIRKCCEDAQYFSLISYSCESASNGSVFYSLVSELMVSVDDVSINLHTSTISFCPETNDPPSIIGNISHHSFVILHTGEILDVPSQVTYNGSEYCLELVGPSENATSFTLALCRRLNETFDYYDYVSYDDTTATLSPVAAANNDSPAYLVRKCCGQLEYYDLVSHKCTSIENSQIFATYVQKLSFETQQIQLEVLSAKIDKCPIGGSLPKILPVSENTHKLRHDGQLIDIPSAVRHNYTHYCLELVGPNPEELSFTVALCPPSMSVPKCCPHGTYFDEIHLDCLPLPSNWTSGDSILDHFQRDSESYSLVPMEYFLRCQNTFPVEESAKKLSLDKGRLCNRVSCYENKDFCVDYLGKKKQNLRPISFYCQKEYFIKCCKKDHILSETGCIEHKGGNSILIKQLQNTRNFANSFDNTKCNKGRGVLLDESLSSHIIWWVSSDGNHLNVQADSNTVKLQHYCIDDYMNSERKIIPSAFVCENDVGHLLPKEHHFLSYSQKGSLGKCCPESSQEGSVYYFSHATGNCEMMFNNLTLSEANHLQSANFTNEHFHDFPECPKDIVEYHAFSFRPGPYDHAAVTAEGLLKIISKDGKCIQREDVVKDRDYCIEFVLTETGELAPSAFICAYSPVLDVYREKYAIVTALLGISCICLLATLVFLFLMRVRRGLVTVRKVNTLAGRILVSFVASHLVGFIAIAVTQHENFLNQVGSRSCYVLAGFIQFFNLATFCWNTSICLESLLLTIHISISECLRYVLHSIWAWGFPCFMTLLMFLMDFYREELPCGTITPKIGAYDCFQSDTNAKLLYFYLPILITLTANVFFLVGAKAMRRARLRRLEEGITQKKSGAKTESHVSGDGSQAHSGMRIHQNRNTKVESVRIVLWTGGLWFAELAGFVITRYVFPHRSEKWYEYLWYIPTSLNALRGFGIFAIVVLTEENRKEIRKIWGTFRKRASGIYKSRWQSSESQSKSRSSSYVVNYFSRRQSFDDNRKRNMSVTTMISTLSSSFSKSRSDSGRQRKSSIVSYISAKIENFRKASSSSTDQNTSAIKNPENINKRTRKIGFVRSISQIDRRASASSSTGSFLEELEMNGGSVKRKYSTNISTTPQMPQLQEEDSHYETTDEKNTEIKSLEHRLNEINTIHEDHS